MLTPLLDDMDQDNMADGGLDDMMENELANMAERDAEVEMVMAEFDAGDTGGMDAADWFSAPLVLSFLFFRRQTQRLCQLYSLNHTNVFTQKINTALNFIRIKKTYGNVTVV